MNDEDQLKNNNAIVPISPTGSDLFARVVSILEQARSNVVRVVNTQMVSAYWLIGQEIVLDLQGGEERAEYGKNLIENLSGRLTKLYGKGYSAPTLWNFRQFYQTYSDRIPEILSPAEREFNRQSGIIPLNNAKISTIGRESKIRGFSQQLSWSHFKALMRVENPVAREFYEKEAIICGWTKDHLQSICFTSRQRLNLHKNWRGNEN
jgi:hypothetical protein